MTLLSRNSFSRLVVVIIIAYRGFLCNGKRLKCLYFVSRGESSAT